MYLTAVFGSHFYIAHAFGYASLLMQESGAVDERSSLLQNPVVNTSNSIPHARCTAHMYIVFIFLSSVASVYVRTCCKPLKL